MSNDLVTLNILAKELVNNLQMGKVLKINQPENDEIRLSIRNNSTNYNLVISSNPNNPRINLTNSKKPNPITCPNFCMLLRKYLTNSIIKNINLENNDRIINIEFESKDELKYTKIYHLYIELINRYSNIIMANENNVIMNSIRQIPFDDNQKRPIVNGIKYEFLPQNNKPCIFNIDILKEKLTLFKDENLSSYILTNFSGLTKNTLQIILDYLNLTDRTKLSDDEINSLCNIINEFATGEITEKLYFYSNDIDYEFSFNKKDKLSFDSLNEAVDYTITLLDKNQRVKDRTKKYYNLLNKYIKKTEKKIQINKDKLTECDGRDIYKLYGELLTSKIYMIKRGISEIEVENYYDDYKPVIIKLDPKLSPNENINLYFKKYNKLKNAEDITLQQLNKNEIDLEYAKSILVDLDKIEYEDSLDDIFDELQTLDIIKPTKKKKKDETQYIKYNVNDNIIIAGKNNIQNDYLTFKMANSQDMWCHVKESHGSHVILFRKDGEINEKALIIALEIAAFYSSNKSDKVAVDYTIRRNVARIDAKHKGLVHYENYKTELVKPNEHKEYMV